MGATFAPDAIPAAPPTEDFEVMPCNWQSVCAFLACETQWRAVATMVGLVWLGLDYTAADIVLRRRQADDAAFADIQVMEQEALSVFAREDRA